MKENPAIILQELESDDELPDSYYDLSTLPAYLDKNRFDQINFPWVKKVNPSSTNAHETVKSQYHSEILCSEGVLKGQDLYCLKSIQSSFTCNNTLVWFMNFLLLKDLQSHYSYLKSCLVTDLISTIPLAKKHFNQSKVMVNKNRYEIVIKR